MSRYRRKIKICFILSIFFALILSVMIIKTSKVELNPDNSIVTTTFETEVTTENATENIIPTEPIEPEKESIPATEATKPTEPKKEPILEKPKPKPKPTKKSIGKYKLTAYCPCSECNGPWQNGITSTGVTAESNRTIAVDPKIIPYGTKVEINGKTYIAEDCGGAIKGKRIDIFFDTHKETIDFGVKYAEVYIYL